MAGVAAKDLRLTAPPQCISVEIAGLGSGRGGTASRWLMSPEPQSWWIRVPHTDPPPQVGPTAAPGDGRCHCLTGEQSLGLGGVTLPAFLS